MIDIPINKMSIDWYQLHSHLNVAYVSPTELAHIIRQQIDSRMCAQAIWRQTGSWKSCSVSTINLLA